MGNTIIRTKLEATVPIAQISIKLLTYQPIQSNAPKTPNVDTSPKLKSVGSKPFKIPIVTPWLCGTLLKNSKESTQGFKINIIHHHYSISFNISL